MKIDNIIKFHEKYKDLINSWQMDEFLELPSTIIDKLIALDDTKYFEYIKDVIFNNIDYLDEEIILKLIDVIKNARSETHAEQACLVASRDQAENDKNFLKSVEVVAKAINETTSEYASTVARNSEVLKSDFSLDLTKMIANSTSDLKIVDIATSLVIDENVIASQYAKELTKICLAAKNKECATNIYKLLDTAVLASEHAIELAKLVANAKTEERSYYAYDVATDLIKYEYIVDLVRIVAIESKEFNVDAVYNYIPAVYDCVDKKLLEFSRAIANAKTKEHAELVSTAAQTETLSECESGVDILKMIANAKSIELAEYAVEVLKSTEMPNGREKYIENIINGIISSKSVKHAENIVALTFEFGGSDEEFLELLEVFGNILKEDYCSCVYNVFSNTYVLASGKVVELTKIVANAKGQLQCEYAAEIATNPKFLNSGYVTQLTCSIANFKNINILCSIWELILIEQSKISIEDIAAVADVLSNCSSDKNCDAVFSLITTGEYKKSSDPITSIKNIIESKNKYVLFVDEYEKSPEAAIAGLKEIENEFPGIDLDTNEYYIKKPKLKKKKSK